MDELVVGQLRFAPYGITEVQPDGDGHVFVAREEIRGLSVARGATSDAPALALAIGLIFSVPSGFFVVALLGLELLAGGFSAPVELHVGLLRALLVLGFGVVLLRDTLARGAYLRVETERGVRKLRGGELVGPADLEETLARARDELGYDM